MCEPKPGARCASDTRGAATATLERYECAYPNGPHVDPVAAARAEQRAEAAADAFARTFDQFVDDPEPADVDLDGEPAVSFERAQAFLAQASAAKRAARSGV